MKLKKQTQKRVPFAAQSIGRLVVDFMHNGDWLWAPRALIKLKIAYLAWPKGHKPCLFLASVHDVSAVNLFADVSQESSGPAADVVYETSSL